MPEFRPQEILRVLADHEVRFIIIGGLAGAFHNVGWVTVDLDVVIDGAAENLASLATALEHIDARFVMLNPAQIIRPTLDRMRSLHGPLLLNTKHGRPDILREAGGFDYEALTADGLVGSAQGLDTNCELGEACRDETGRKPRKAPPGATVLEEALAARSDADKEPD